MSRMIDDVSHSYEVVIGGWDNSRSVIRATPHGDIEEEAETIGILDCDVYKTFWLSWAGGHIEVGTGAEVGSKRFMHWVNPNVQWNVTAVGVSTGYDREGDWSFITNQGYYCGYSFHIEVLPNSLNSMLKNSDQSAYTNEL